MSAPNAVTADSIRQKEADERRRCADIIEKFAAEYVNKWLLLEGESVKAQGYAILQAAAHLRSIK